MAVSERQQEFLGEIVAMTRRLDPTRLVVDNSGFDHLDTDIVDLHDTTQDPATFVGHGRSIRVDRVTVNGHKVMIDRVPYDGQPIIVSGFGGIRLETDRPGDWGHGRPAKSERELTRRYKQLVRALQANKSVAGFCYSQQCDVEHDATGLHTCDRQPKVEPAAIAKINLSEPRAPKRKGSAKASRRKVKAPKG